MLALFKWEEWGSFFRSTSVTFLYRLVEDTFTVDEVREMLDGLQTVVRGEVEMELINTAHTNVLLLRQLFSQAEKFYLRLQSDISELENRWEQQRLQPNNSLLEHAGTDMTRLCLVASEDTLGSLWRTPRSLFHFLHMTVKDQSERLLQKHGLLCECKESQRRPETRVSVINQVANHIFRGRSSHK